MQNYRNIYQDAIKSSEYAKNQIAFHPITTYYLNVSGNSTKDKLLLLQAMIWFMTI